MDASIGCFGCSATQACAEEFKACMFNEVSLLDAVSRFSTLLFGLYFVIAIVTKSAGGVGAYVLFTYHPMFMACAFVVLMSNGLTSYRLKLPAFLHRYLRTKDDYRQLHAGLQFSAFLFAMAGFFAIFANHAVHHQSQFAEGQTPARKAHVAVGYFTLALLIGQCAVGLFKVVYLGREGKPTMKWHGLTGPFIWLSGCVAVGIGIGLQWLVEVDGKPKPHRAHGVVLEILLAICVLTTALNWWFTARPEFPSEDRHAVNSLGLASEASSPLMRDTNE